MKPVLKSKSPQMAREHVEKDSAGWTEKLPMKTCQNNGKFSWNSMFFDSKSTSKSSRFRLEKRLKNPLNSLTHEHTGTTSLTSLPLGCDLSGHATPGRFSYCALIGREVTWALFSGETSVRAHADKARAVVFRWRLCCSRAYMTRRAIYYKRRNWFWVADALTARNFGLSFSAAIDEMGLRAKSYRV